MAAMPGEEEAAAGSVPRSPAADVVAGTPRAAAAGCRGGGARGPAADVVAGTPRAAAAGCRGGGARGCTRTVRVKLECEAELRVFIETKVHEAAAA